MGLYEHLASRYDELFPASEASVDFVIAGMDPKAPRSVLDLGSATGGTVLAFAARGWRAIGVELDATMTCLARAKRTDAPQAPRFLCADMRDAGSLLAGQEFGAALCAGNTIPHLPRTGLEEFFRTVAGLLATGGCFVTQTLNYAHPDIGPGYEFPVIGIPGLRFLRSYARAGNEAAAAAGDPRALEFRTELQTPDGTERDLTILHPVRPEELEAAMRAAGFSGIERFQGWAGGGFDPERDRFLILRAYRRL